MVDLYTCESCGFMSTLSSEFKLFKRVLLCKDCMAYYGTDPDVTNWVNQATKEKNENQS